MGIRDRSSLVQAALVFVAVALLGALAVRHFQQLEVAERRRAAAELARGSAFAIEQRFGLALQSASTLAAMVTAGASDAQLDAVVRRHLALTGGGLNLQLAPDGVIARMWPPGGNESALRFDLVHSPVHGPFVKRVVESRGPLLYGPFALVQGSTGFALRVPVFVGERGERFWGLASAIIRVGDLLRESRLSRLDDAGLEYGIWRAGGEGTAWEVVASSARAPSTGDDAVTVPVELPGQRWQLGVVPRGGWAQGTPRLLGLLVLLVALLAAVLAYRILALPAVLRQEVAARTRELEVAHADQRRAEEAQRQSQKLESIGLLAGGVAHDFNNLLVGILGYADLLAAEALPGSTAAEAAETIGQAARRAAELTRQLLALARLGQHRQERVDLHALVSEAAKLLGRTLEKSIRLEKRLLATAHAVRGDPGQLQQVILNLAVNARDAMPGGGLLTLETGAAEVSEASAAAGLTPGPYVTLGVADTGVGIPPEHLARLFEPFFTTKPVGKGSGLGLATAFGIVKGHGGTIRVDSVVGRGSRFTVYLPALGETVARPLDREDAVPHGRGVILVVDDEELVRRTAARVLESLGYEPVVASGGQEALDWLAAQAAPPAAVLLDLAMPGMDGRACFRKMRARHPGLRVVVCSGFSQSGGAQELLAEGAAAFVQKPYRTGELARALAELAATAVPAA